MVWSRKALRLTANFDRRFVDNEEWMMMKIQNLEDTQSQELREMGKEIKKLQPLPEKVDELT